MSATNETVPVAKAPVKAMWVCIVIAIVFFALPIPGSSIVAVPVGIAAIVLAILCLIRGRIGQGVVGLIILTIGSVIAFLVGLALFASGAAGLSETTVGALERHSQEIAAPAPEIVPAAAMRLARECAPGDAASARRG